jgi:hypothetical protein
MNKTGVTNNFLFGFSGFLFGFQAFLFGFPGFLFGFPRHPISIFFILYILLLAFSQNFVSKLKKSNLIFFCYF